MNDKQFKQAKNRTTALFKKWIKQLGLGWYKIDIQYKMGDSDSNSDFNAVYMDTVCLWHYRTAQIRVWVEVIPNDLWEVERAVVHELCHILVSPMQRPDIDREKLEYTVEGLARAFLWTAEVSRGRIKK